MGHFANEEQILFCFESGDVDITITLIHDLYVNQTFAGHDSFHETEVEAPDHDDAQDNTQRRHHNPVFDVLNIKDIVICGCLGLFAIVLVL